VTEDAAIDWSPVWSSKGDQLYFLSDRGGSMNIWRVPVDERSGRALGPLEPVTVPAPYVGGLALARDGKALVYSQASQRTTLHWIGYDPVHRSVVGTPQAVDTEHTVANFSFSPDGSKIVFDTIGDTPEELWIMNADGSGRRRLTSDGHRNRTPAWSPDAKEIVFFSDRSGQYDTWLIQPNGSGLRPLTTGTHPAMQRAIWSPDGTRILASRSPGPSVMLDPNAAAPVSSPRPAEGIQGMVYWNAWTAGGDGSLAIGDLVASDNPSASSIVGSGEIVVYSPAEAHAERTGVTGRRAFWLPASNRSDPPHRSFIFARVGECWLYDRALRREVRLFSVAPNRLYYLGGVGPDQHRIYFSQTVRDADLWLARLAK
jgi:dipeptidyl aminopeptidase/acylaminoacyl peptidase